MRVKGHGTIKKSKAYGTIGTLLLSGVALATVSVGTTSVRVLESCADEVGHIKPGFGETKIFIYPGYKFKILDALITNFHLPESTLIMLVSAFAGVQETLNFYNVAVKEKYRFFSFGDACFIYWQKNNIKE